MIKLGVGIHCHVTGAFPIIRQPPGDRRWPRWCPSFFGPRPSANCRIPITTSRPPPPLLGCWENHLRSAEVGGSCQLHDVRPMRSEKLTSKQQTDTRTHTQTSVYIIIYICLCRPSVMICHDVEFRKWLQPSPIWSPGFEGLCGQLGGVRPADSATDHGGPGLGNREPDHVRQSFYIFLKCFVVSFPANQTKFFPILPDRAQMVAYA